MAHRIDRMMYAGKTPWHGLGIRLPETCDSDTLRNLVFDWHVIEKPITVDGETWDDYKALVRSDTGDKLCIQPKSYGVVDFSDSLALLDAASVDGRTKYITAATLDGGRRAFALATIPSATFDVAGSEIKPYLLLSTSHDGSLALRVHFTGIYVVCNNTLTAALAAAGATGTRYIPNVITLKHTARIKDRMTVVTRLIERAGAYFGQFHERALRLVNWRYTTADMRDLAKALFPVSDKVQNKVVSLFNGEQRARAQAPGTRWAALNAVTEYIDHHARRRGSDERTLAEHRFEATMFGAGAKVRQQALDMLLAA